MFLGYIDPGTGFTITGIGGWLIAAMLGFFGVFLVFFKKMFNFFKKNIKWILAAIIILASLGLFIKGVIMNRRSEKFDDRIIILGFDAISPKILEPMMDKGLLPNFSRLKAEGSYDHLSTTNPPQSPVAWTGFSTGQNPGKNGIFDFIVRDPDTYQLDLSLSKMKNGRPVKTIQSKSFWQYLSEINIPSTIITCPVTYPPDKIKGKMLSGMGVPDILGTEGTFLFYTSEPLGKGKDIGGRVFHVNKAPVMVMHILGPKVASFNKEPDNIKVPFKATLENNDKVLIEYEKTKIELRPGQWSNWCETEFNLGIFKKVKGIFKFCLISTEPEFKLYISPINFDPRKPFFNISYPKNYSKDLSEVMGLYHTQGMAMDTWAVNEGRLSEELFLEEAERIFNEKKSMLNYEMNHFNEGLLFCYFDSVDIIQHMFWRYTDPEHPLYEADASQEYKTQIEIWYKRLDAVLGDILRRLKPDDTLIVLSDHGFDTFRRAAHLNSWLRENGYLVLKNPYAKEGADLLLDIDWTNTRAYAIGFGAIYINQKGREGSGIVQQGKETESLKEEISNKLEQWIDEKTGKNIVNNAYKKEDIFTGKCAEMTPDIYVGFNSGYRASWQTALGGVPEGLIEDNLKKWSGTHLIDPVLVPGVILSNKKITKEDPSIYDIAPTVLSITGYSDEDLDKCDFDGTPLM